jgi:hypothetical protein
MPYDGAVMLKTSIYLIIFTANTSSIRVLQITEAIVGSPRNGFVAHNSRVKIFNNVVVGADGSAIFLESGTETGVVESNFVVGTGGGTR